MEMNEPYPTEVTQQIAAFVDRIEQVLLSQRMPRSERTNICQEVETQIQMMIERRLESGAELNIDLVHGIIESMDPPESYAPAIDPVAESTLEPVLQTETEPPASKPSSKQPESKPWSKPPFLDTLQKLLDRPKRTTPALDWVAICGLVATCLGLFLMVARPGRGDGSAFIGVFMIVAGVTASGVSFWRIRHSKGLLTGQRIASVGILLLPVLLLNALVIAIFFATPLGIVLGAIAVVAALIYGNYYVLRRSMRWLANYTVKSPEGELANPDLSTAIPHHLQSQS